MSTTLATATATTPLLPSSSLSSSPPAKRKSYTMATALFSGASFGAAMVVSGVVQQNIIISQFKFTDFHMLETFLSAIAASTLVITILQHLGAPHQTPRSPSPIGFFPYDGNFIGGSLLGTGMALTGSCPGTVYAQLGVAAPLSLITLAGSITGGILFTGAVNPALSTIKQKLLPADSRTGKLTVAQALGLTPTAGSILFAALTFGTAVILWNTFPASPYAHGISPLLGGLLIGISQLISYSLRNALLGVSGSFEEVGKTVLAVMTGGRWGLPAAYNNLLFAGGVVVGAAVVGWVVPEWGVVVPAEGITVGTAFLGGVLMVVGSRVAGGCTSGHGISGMGMLSLSSFVTIGAAFGVAGLLWGGGACVLPF